MSTIERRLEDLCRELLRAEFLFLTSEDWEVYERLKLNRGRQFLDHVADQLVMADAGHRATIAALNGEAA